MRVRFDQGRECTLRPLNLVGAAADCFVRLQHGTVAPYHAEIARGRHSWEIADFGSPNGTWVGGKQLARTVRYPLSVGDRIHVGGARWLDVLDEAPPRPFLERIDGGGAIDLEEGRTRLPASGTAHQALNLTSYEDEHQLLAEDLASGVCREVAPGERIHIAGVEYEVWLPVWPKGTLHTPQQLELHFEFTPDEAMVRAEARAGGAHQSLMSMPFQARQLLVALIERKRDELSRGAPALDAGAVTAEQISEELIPGEGQLPTPTQHYQRGFAAIQSCRRRCREYALLGADAFIRIDKRVATTRYAVSLHPERVTVLRHSRIA